MKSRYFIFLFFVTTLGITRVLSQPLSNDLQISFYNDDTVGIGAGYNLIFNLGSYDQFGKNDGQSIQFTSLLGSLKSTFGDNWYLNSNLKWIVSGGVEDFASSIILQKYFRSGEPPSDEPDKGDIDRIFYYSLHTPLFYPSSQWAQFKDDVGSGVLSVTDSTAIFEQNYGRSFHLMLKNSSSFRDYLSDDLYTKMGIQSLADFYSFDAVDDSVSKLGFFFVDQDGVHFTAAGASAIPEPSSYAAIAGAAILGFVVSRRKARVA